MNCLAFDTIPFEPSFSLSVAQAVAERMEEFGRYDVHVARIVVVRDGDNMEGLERALGAEAVAFFEALHGRDLFLEWQDHVLFTEICFYEPAHRCVDLLLIENTADYQIGSFLARVGGLARRPAN